MECINTTKDVSHNVKALRFMANLVNTVLISKEKFMFIVSGAGPASPLSVAKFRGMEYKIYNFSRGLQAPLSGIGVLHPIQGQLNI